MYMYIYFTSPSVFAAILINNYAMIYLIFDCETCNRRFAFRSLIVASETSFT